MKNKYLFIALSLFSSVFLFGQEPEREDDLGDVSDLFQTNFYEAIKQKGIENYDKAIDLLIECKIKQPNNASIYFELGKNYLELDKPQLAADALEKANTLKPNNEWILVTLFQHYKNEKETDKAISTLKKLASLKGKYNETLAYYYVTNGMHQENLTLLDALDKQRGITIKTERYRYRSYQATKQFKTQATYITKKVNNQTATEYDYTLLIYAYSKLNDDVDSFKTMLAFAKAYPNSDKPALGLYKHYIQQNNTTEAINSLLQVANSKTLSDSEKFKVTNDFYNYTKQHPEHLPALEKAVEAAPNKLLTQKMIHFYSAEEKKQKSNAIIATSLKNIPTNFTELKDFITLLLENNKIENALSTSNKALERYPAQPIFYVQKATALNKLNKLDEALETLEIGIDFIIENNKILAAFYKQMAVAYQQKGAIKKQQEYLQKAQKLKL